MDPPCLSFIRRLESWTLQALCAIACLIVTTGAQATDAGSVKRVLDNFHR